MKQFIATLAVSSVLFGALPFGALAQDPPASETPLIEGLDELAEGMRKLLEGFTDDMAPMVEDMAEQLKGLNAYHPPEVLPNGDIIIRRKTPKDAPKDAPEKPKADDQDAIDI